MSVKEDAQEINKLKDSLQATKDKIKQCEETKRIKAKQKKCIHEKVTFNLNWDDGCIGGIRCAVCKKTALYIPLSILGKLLRRKVRRRIKKQK